jgi:hypothetical protein
MAHAAVQKDQYWVRAGEGEWREELADYLELSGFPKNFKLKTPAIAKFSVDTAVANVMTGYKPVIRVLLPGRESTARLAAQERLERGYEGLNHAVVTSKTENPFRQMMWHCLAYGLGVIASPPASKLVWPEPPFGRDGKGKPREGRTARQRQMFARWERQRMRGLPWDVRVVHPLNAFFDPDHDPPRWMVERRRVSIDAMRQQFPRVALAGSGVDPVHELLIYCDADWYACYLDEQPLLDSQDGADEDGVAPNPCGDLWYDFAWSGMGDVSDDGNYVHRMKGIIRDNIPAFKMYITELNVIEAIRKVNAFPTLNLRPGPRVQSLQDLMTEQAIKEADALGFGPGKVWRSLYWEVAPLALPDVTQALMAAFDESRRLIEIGVGPSVLRGEWRDETASGQLTRLEQARTPLLPAKASGEQAVSNMYWKMGYQLKEVYREALTRYTVQAGKRVLGELRPEDIDIRMQIEVDFTPPTQAEIAAKQSLLLERAGAGGVSLRRLVTLDDTPVDDPESEIADIMADRLLQAWVASPAALQLVTQGPGQEPGGAPQEGMPLPQEGMPLPQEGMPLPQEGMLLG